MFVAGSSKADSRRRAHTRARQKKFCELERASRAESLGYSHPNKHRPARFFSRPPSAAQSLDEHIAAFAVLFGNLAHVLLTLVERNYRRDLNRLKDTVIHVALYASKRRKRLSVTHTEANAPPGHAVALRQGKNLDGHLLCAFHLKYAGRNVAVKYQVGVGKVVYHKYAESSGQLDHFLEELYLHALSRRVIREGDCDQFGAMGLDDGRQPVQQIIRARCRNLHKLSAGDNHRVRMNRISGLRHERRFS